MNCKTTKVWIMSDLHQEFDEFAWKSDNTPDHDLLILAGDIHSPAKAAIDYAEQLTDKPIIMICGNHEFYGGTMDEVLAEARLRAKTSSNIHFLENDSIIIGDIRVLGCTLWTDFELFGRDQKNYSASKAEKVMNDYRRIKRVGKTSGRRRRIRPEHTLVRHRKSRHFIEMELSKTHDGPTIVVTHHAPTKSGVADEHRNQTISAAYASNMDDVITTHQPDLWVFGHTHLNHDSQIGSTRIVSNAKGYGDQNSEFEPEFVIEV